MSAYRLTHLDLLESEGIHIIREVVAQLENPVLLFSGGKDSIVLLHLARKAFAPGPLPFPLMHIDTGHNFPETIAFRDKIVKEVGCELIVKLVQDSIDQGRAHEESGPNPSRNGLQTVTLLDGIADHKFDACFGGARRDEEKARAKERVFSHRDAFGQWDPKNQRPELWDLYNGKKQMGENFRIFPISNWTEMDVWQYIKREELELPTIYFSHKRNVLDRDGCLLAECDYVTPVRNEAFEERTVRFRTVGDMSCTGSVESDASTIDEIIREIAVARVTERGGRSDDKRSEAAMEDRKKEGYF